MDKPMKKIYLSIVACGLLMSSVGLSIGRIGNGRISSVESGFETSVPEDFLTYEEKPNGRLVLTAPTKLRAATNGFYLPEQLDVREFLQSYPYLASLGRDSFHDHFMTQSNEVWTSIAVPEGCVEAFMAESKETLVVLASWGGGRGVVFIGANSEFIRASINQALHTLKLNDGACQWK